MPTISANTTQTITLAASTLMRGIGAAVLSWGTPLQTVTHTAGDEWHFGPFTAAQAVSIHAQSLLTYSTQAVSDDDPVDKLGLKFDGGLTAAQVAGLNAGNLVDAAGGVLALSEVVEEVLANPSATTQILTGPGEYFAYRCTVAAGNITVYDNTASSGKLLVPTTALALGTFPIFGAGISKTLQVDNGIRVVLSGAATVYISRMVY